MSVKGGQVVDDLEDARWPLVDAMETARRFRSVLREGAALLQHMEQLLAESQAALVRTEKAHGATHFLKRQVARVDGLAVSVNQENLLEPLLKKLGGSSLRVEGVPAYGAAQMKAARAGKEVSR